MNISFTGHRNFDSDRFAQELYDTILSLTASGEQTIFWSGMAVGFDLAAAEAVLDARDNGADVKLCCVVPYVGQALFFNRVDLARYEAVIRSADRVITLAQEYNRDVFFRRNDYLVERADKVVAYYDGVQSGGTFYTYRKSRKKGVEVINLYPQQQLSLF